MKEMKKLLPIPPVHENINSYLEELRSRYGGQVYEINRYVEVFKVRSNLWAMFAPCTHAVADNWLYLIEGPEKALFIDNGFGIGNLKGLGEMLTGKPVICAVTHCHGDHSGGNMQWDKVYCHEYCAQMLENQMYPEFWAKFNHVDEDEHRRYYKDEDIIPFRKYEPIPLSNHYVINLGEDYDVELIHMGGHSPGLSCFLDKKSRILFSGDSIFESRIKGLGVGLHGARPGVIHPETLHVKYYLEQLEELNNRTGEFEYVMPGHGFIDSPMQIVPDLLRAVISVVADPDCYDMVIKRRGRNTYIKSGGLADVLYVPEEIEKELAES